MSRLQRARRELALLRRDPLLFALVIVIALALFTFVLAPLFAVLVKSLQVRGTEGLTLANYERFANTRYLRQALVNSLKVGVSTATVGVFIGYIAAFTLTRTNIPGKPIWHVILILPVISPPFVSAISILMLFGFNGLFTKQLLGIQDFNIYGYRGVVLSQIFTFAPIGYMTLRGVLGSLSPTLEDAAMNMGATRWQTFHRVVLPLSLPGIASAFLVVIIESLADF
ncbi:MAG: ABC transporter permease subunit, partial [Candidatus Zophobacter franzmannii]|nr:ABC transporter permease subunit [Candidatus Zophobacter franzmannii]